MRKFGLIGKTLTHSFSKKYFEDKFQREQITNCSYDLFELKTIEAFPVLLKSNPQLVGLNVTIPYKESVMPYLDSITEQAQKIGAVNCIRIVDGKTEGWNSDTVGFSRPLLGLLTETLIPIPTQSFVLGTGGSSKAIVYALEQLGLPFVKVSREAKQNCIRYEEIAMRMKEANLFINTTPVGMFPNQNDCPNIPYEKLSSKDFLFDLIYNPAETEFLKHGKLQGARTKGGLEMLQLQAEKSWEIWNS